MTSWNGRFRSRQCIPNKRHKVGIELYEHWELYGFILNFIPYVGEPTVIDSDPGSGKCEKIALKLMEPSMAKEHDLYTTISTTAYRFFYNCMKDALIQYELFRPTESKIQLRPQKAN